MNKSGYNIADLVEEAQTRWLKPAEILFILQNHEDHQIKHEPPQKPPSGALFLFNRRVLRFFRKDGHSWRRKRDGRTVGEAHERLKVGNVEALNCYYAHGEQNPNFQRRCYWMLDPAHDHIVLVHYRDISEGRQNAVRNVLQSSTVSATLGTVPNTYSNQQLGSSMVNVESYERCHNLSSPGSVEINSDPVIMSNGVNHLGAVEKPEEASSSPSLEMSQALRRLEEQLSLNDESFQDIGSLYSENEKRDDFYNTIYDQSSYGGMEQNPNDLLFRHHSGDSTNHHQFLNEAGVWKEMLDSSGSSQNVDLQAKYGNNFDENVYDPLSFCYPASIPQEVEGFKYHPYPLGVSVNGTNADDYIRIFDQGQNGSPLEDGLRLTIAQNQKFTIQEISPEWGYANEVTKVIVIGAFLCDPSESVWTCMFGDIEVPVQIVQDGVLRCLSPPNLPPGKVTLCVSCGSRESCSEVREFEYHVKPTISTHTDQPETDCSRSPEELLLLARFVQMLLSDSQMQKGGSAETGTDLPSKSGEGEDSWVQVIERISDGTWTSSMTTDWLLQELVKDKLQHWLYSKSQEDINQLGCSLSKKEQGIIHMIAGLGFEWALNPILKSGVSVNFRDINGWAPLHWAARFGREKMVAALMASGASAEAVTDANPQDPVGKTPAAIAAAYGHKGVAGYLSEVAVTSHLSSLTLEESELSKGCAAVEAEKTISTVSETTPSTDTDELSLKDSLAAYRNAAQAAARIQSAFRAHSFRKRQQRGAAAAAAFASAIEDEYGVISIIPGLSTASKLAFRNARDYHSAAVSIQKKYRGWKGRKDFLAFRQKVVKIQAHIRGYQVRKQYHVCWAVGILEKVVLRWRRRGVGFRGYRHGSEFIDESDDEEILRVFRRKKVDAALDEAVSRVLSMVECPEARQQYRRILEKYRQAKAELEGAQKKQKEMEKEKGQSSKDDFTYMENDGNYQFM